jgi:hypothetical protein
MDRPYIKEFDFKQFFDKIHVNRITEILLDRGVPKSVVYFLENINRSEVKFAAEDLLEEPSRETHASHRDIREGILNPARDMYLPIKEFLAAQPGIEGYMLLSQFMREDGIPNIQEYFQVQ